MTEVLTQTQDGVLIITINRPEARNAVNRAVAEGIAAAMEQLDSDVSLNAGIITGAGGTFCSGMDLKAFLKGELPSIKGKGFAGFIEAPPKKPLIGAIVKRRIRFKFTFFSSIFIVKVYAATGPLTRLSLGNSVDMIGRELCNRWYL